MNEKEIITFAKLAGLSRPTVSNEWVMFSCPFAPFYHEKGRDSTPSLGIKIEDGAASGYNCFACKAKGGSCRWMLRQLSGLKGQSYKDAYMYLTSNEARPELEKKAAFASTFSTVKRRNSEPKEDFSDKPEPERPTIDESRLEKFSDEPHKYILARGLTRDTCNEWGICTDYSSKYPRVVFPVRDIDGQLLAFSRRVVWNKPTCQWCGYSHSSRIKFGTSRKEGDPKSKGGCPECTNRWVWPKYQHSKGFHRNWYLYGEHMIDRSSRVGVIVEGNIDPIWLWQCGVANAVATLGSKPGEKWPNKRHGKPGEQIYLMSQYFDKIVLLPDSDAAGTEWASKIRETLDGKMNSTGTSLIKVFECQLPKGKDPAVLSSGEIKDLLSSHEDVWRK